MRTSRDKNNGSTGEIVQVSSRKIESELQGRRRKRSAKCDVKRTEAGKDMRSEKEGSRKGCAKYDVKSTESGKGLRSMM